MTYLKLVATMFLWGGTFIAGRLLAGEVSPPCAAFVRFALASVLLVGMIRAVEGRLPRISRRQAVGVVLLGLTGVFGYNVLFFAGLQTVGAGRAAMIIALNPVGIAVLSALFCREPLGPLGTLGILVSVTGALFVVTDGHLSRLLAAGAGAGLGELYLLGCVLCWSAYSVLGRRVMGGLSPLVAVGYSAVAGTALLLPVALLGGVQGAVWGYGARAWASLVYLAVFGTVLAFIWYYQGIKSLGAPRAGVFINLVPVCAVLQAFVLLGEPLTPALVGGGAITLAGVWLTNAARRPGPERRLGRRPLAGPARR